MLALEKLFVLIGGIGLGWLLFGAMWLVGPPPTDSFNVRFYRAAPRDCRRGTIVALLGFAVAGAIWLIRAAS